MKKILMIAGLLLICKSGFCNGFSDQWAAALLSHTETIVETKTNGTTATELLATPIQIGKIRNEYILGIDGGVLGEINPKPGDAGIKWTAGIHLHLTPILKSFFTKITPNYPALTSIEVNPRFSYDFTKHSSELGIGAGWAFGLDPLNK